LCFQTLTDVFEVCTFDTALNRICVQVRGYFVDLLVINDGAFLELALRPTTPR